MSGATKLAKLCNSGIPLLLLLLVSSIARAERLPIRAYTTADGLAHNVINKIVRDSHGFLWFCTNEGLSRFDGYSFRNYDRQQGLPHAIVNDLLETRGGEYWLASNGGLVRFDPRATASSQVVYLKDRAGSSTEMFTVIVPEGEDRLARAINVLLEARDGTIWCGTYKGLYRLERTNDRVALRPVDIGIPQQNPEQGFISDLLEDRNGSLWIATPAGLYRRRPDGSAARYTKDDGLPDDYIHDLFADHLGRLWVGSRYGGLFSFTADDTHGPPKISFGLTVTDGLATGWIFQLLETSDQRFWAATARGLIEFFPDAKPLEQRFRGYSEKNGLIYHDITALGEDVAGNLWLGSNVGAMKLARNGFVTYEVQDGVLAINAIFNDLENGVCFRGYVLGDKRTSIFDGGKVDLMNQDQIVDWPRLGRFDGQRFTWFAPDVFKTASWGWVGEGVTLQARNGEWWIAASDGLYRFPAAVNFTQIKHARPLTVFTEKKGLGPGRVYRIFEDSRGDVWISTTSPNGLARWERESETISDVTNSAGLALSRDELARAFGEDRSGNVWIGFATGVARYHQGSFTFFTTKDGLPPGAIEYIYGDRTGRLWLASSRGGLIRIDEPEAQGPAFLSYTTAQGLSSDDAKVITEDLRGHIYVGTGRGLDRLNPANGAIEHFTTADGLAAGEFLAAFRDHDGALWFGTQKGMSRFLPGPDRRATPPPILIAGLQVAGARQIVSALGEKEITLPNLAASQNQLQIDFLALGFAPGEVLRYQYKLEGADPDWGAPTEHRTVNYARLAPGHYKFLVRAVTSDGSVSAAPALVTFTILPHLWQQWWFLALASLAAVAMLYALYRYRMARLLEMTNMRTRIATDLHDDIGANLTRIALLSEVAEQHLGEERDVHGGSPRGAPDNGRQESSLSSIARIARESVGSMSDIVWAINPERDSLLDLTRKMRQHADEVFTLRDIELRFNASGEKETMRLGADVRRDLLLTFKEAVNNAARHSQCSRVQIDFRLESPALVLEITDNGVGFDTEAESQGQGLRSMMRRAKALRGTLELTSHPGATTVRVSIPLARARRV